MSLENTLQVPEWKGTQSYADIGEFAYYQSLNELIIRESNPYSVEYSGLGKLNHTTGHIEESVFAEGSEMYHFHQAAGKALFDMFSVTSDTGQKTFPCTGALTAFAKDGITVAAYPSLIAATQKQSLAIAEGILHDLWEHRKEHPLDPTNPSLTHAFIAVFMSQDGTVVYPSEEAENLALLSNTLQLMENMHARDRLSWNSHRGNDPLHNPEEFGFSANGEPWFMAGFSQQAQQKARLLPQVAYIDSDGIAHEYPVAVGLLIDEEQRLDMLKTLHTGDPDKNRMAILTSTIRRRFGPFGSDLPPLLSAFGQNTSVKVNDTIINYSELWDIVEFGSLEEKAQMYLAAHDIIKQFCGKIPFGPSTHDPEALWLSEPQRRRVLRQIHQGRTME